MEAAAHTPGGYGGVPQKVGKEFVSADMEPGEIRSLLHGLVKVFTEEAKEPEHQQAHDASRAALSARIRREIARGHKPEQAVAIAFHELGEDADGKWLMR